MLTQLQMDLKTNNKGILKQNDTFRFKKTLSVAIIAFGALGTTHSQVSFRLSPSVFTPLEQGSIAFSDVDLDGDADVIVSGIDSNSVPQTILYENDGAGNFSIVVGTPFVGVQKSDIEFNDIDGDGDEDVFVIGTDGSNTGNIGLYLNDGSGNFTIASALPIDTVIQADLALADVDLDGDDDFIIIGYNNLANSYIAELYTNDGNGNFSLVNNTPFTGVSNGSVSFADVDGDGDQDLHIGGIFYSFMVSDLFLNDGAGNFSLVSGTPFTSVIQGDITFADLDGDGDEDILISGSDSLLAVTTKIYSNDGLGNFSLVSGTTFSGNINGSIDLADIDLDGDLDVLLSGTPNQQMYLNNGNLGFTGLSSGSFTSGGGPTAFEDVDGDGDQDFLIAGVNASGPVTVLYINDITFSSLKEVDNNNEVVNLQIYPNPNNGNFSVQLRERENSMENALVKIYDVMGKLVKRETLNQDTKIIEAIDLNAGIYLVKIEIEGKSSVQRFTIEK